jgi:hypothetical protein
MYSDREYLCSAQGYPCSGQVYRAACSSQLPIAGTMAGSLGHSAGLDAQPLFSLRGGSSVWPQSETFGLSRGLGFLERRRLTLESW